SAATAPGALTESVAVAVQRGASYARHPGIVVRKAAGGRRGEPGALEIGEIGRAVIARRGQQRHAVLRGRLLEECVPLANLSLASRIGQGSLRGTPTLRDDRAQLVIDGVLQQLAELRQTNRALGLSDGTGKHNNIRVGSQRVDNLH